MQSHVDHPVAGLGAWTTQGAAELQHKVDDTFPVAVGDQDPAVVAVVGVDHEHRRASHHQDAPGSAHFAGEGRRHGPGRRLALEKKRV